MAAAGPCAPPAPVQQSSTASTYVVVPASAPRGQRRYVKRAVSHRAPPLPVDAPQHLHRQQNEASTSGQHASAGTRLAALQQSGHIRGQRHVAHSVYRQQTLYEKEVLHMQHKHEQATALAAALEAVPIISVPETPSSKLPHAAGALPSGTSVPTVPSTRLGKHRAPRRTRGRRHAAAQASPAAAGSLSEHEVQAAAAALAASYGVEPAAVEGAALRRVSEALAALLPRDDSPSANRVLSPAVLSPPPPDPLSARRGAAAAATRPTAAALPGAVSCLLAAASGSRLLTRKEEARLVAALQLGNQLRAVAARCRGELGRPPRADELAAAAGLSGGAAAVMAALPAGAIAKEQLLRANVRLVLKVAQRYRKAMAGADQSMNVGMEDLVAVGMEGLEQGLMRFDASRGFKLSTYCYWWILSAMTHAFSELHYSTRLPRSVMYQLTTMYRALRDLQAELGRCPTTAELAAATGFNPKTLARLQRLRRRRELPLDRAAPGLGQEGEGSEGSSLAELIEDPDTLDAHEDAVAAEMRRTLAAAMRDVLSERDAQVLVLLYGLDGDGQRMTQKKVARLYGLSASRIGQLQSSAMERLKKAAPAYLSELVSAGTARQLVRQRSALMAATATASAAAKAKYRAGKARMLTEAVKAQEAAASAAVVAV